MSAPAPQPLSLLETFDEKQFYLDEFRGRTLLVAHAAEALAGDEDCARWAAMLRELLLNDTRVIVLAATPDRRRADQVTRRLERRLAPLIFRDAPLPLRVAASAFSPVAPDAFATASGAELLARIWISLRVTPLFVGLIAGAAHPAATAFAQELGTRLRVHKLILIEPDGGLHSADGKTLSFMDEAALTALLSSGEAESIGLAPRRATLHAVRAALVGGVSSVNVCTFAGTARELFTYEGSGTLFSREDYCTVQRLGIDDFAEVERLIARGQREGILKLRTADEVAHMLINGYGATIGTHHLAGVCALITNPYRAEHAGEIVGLYTMTRFKGEGVGMRLISRVLEDARITGLRYVFATTTEQRARAFFERQGFRRVRPRDVPAGKWTAYDPQRKARVAVLRCDLPPAPATPTA